MVPLFLSILWGYCLGYRGSREMSNQENKSFGINICRTWGCPWLFIWRLNWGEWRGMEGGRFFLAILYLNAVADFLVWWVLLNVLIILRRQILKCISVMSLVFGLRMGGNIEVDDEGKWFDRHSRRPGEGEGRREDKGSSAGLYGVMRLLTVWIVLSYKIK